MLFSVFFCSCVTNTTDSKDQVNCEYLKEIRSKKHDNYRMSFELISDEEFQEYLKAKDGGFQRYFSALNLRRIVEFQKVEEIYKKNPTQENKISYLKARARMLTARDLSGQSIYKDIPILKKAFNEMIAANKELWCLCEMTEKERNNINYCVLPTSAN